VDALPLGLYDEQVLRVDFTIEPFIAGSPGRHVTLAVEAVRRHGIEVDFGPFGSSFDIDPAAIHTVVAELLHVAYSNGATNVSVDVVGANDHHDESPAWEGVVIGGVRLPALHGVLNQLIESVERELGSSLKDLSRNDKQTAIRLLDERGAFILRRAVEDVADAMGVSRITVYNYLNALHR
jgi:uncharacterized protein YqgV (UPF0045/DUF77 family)